MMGLEFKVDANIKLAKNKEENHKYTKEKTLIKGGFGNHKGKTLKELEAISNEYNERALQEFRNTRKQD